jgi:hypothetical protein
VYRNPYKFFRVGVKEYEKQIQIIYFKKQQTNEQQKSVRLRVRHQLVQSMQQIFCGYIRDPHVKQENAYNWFQTDVQYALGCCNDIYNQINLKNMSDDVINIFYNETNKPRVANMLEVNSSILSNLHRNGSDDDLENINTNNEVVIASVF